MPSPRRAHHAAGNPGSTTPRANRGGAASYNALLDAHLTDFFASKPSTRTQLADVGMVTENLKVVEDADRHMRVVDQALAILACDDASAVREAYVVARGDAVAKLVQRREAEALAKRQQVLARYAKERLHRVESKAAARTYGSPRQHGETM